MDGNEALKNLERVREQVRRVLRHYVDERGCPCDYRPFIYWAGKKQGPGWQDNVQNILVKSALELPFFEKTEVQSSDWGYSGSWFCRGCGTLWRHISIEWRMLAFHERLLREGEDDPDTLYPALMSTDIAATAGFEPRGLEAISLEQWVEFMTGREYSSGPWRPGP
jgi:hypothetical protein